MSNSAGQATDPACMTVGQLISELCRWPDHAAVHFRCPVQHQDLRFYCIESRAPGIVEIVLDPAPESAPVVPA
jgi:hypothetical protein